MGNSSSAECPACTLTDCDPLKIRMCQDVGPSAVETWKSNNLPARERERLRTEVDNLAMGKRGCCGCGKGK